MSNYKEKLKDITTFMFDYDGVISDGMIYVVDGKYDQVRNSNVKDGYGMHQAVLNGYRIVIISGGKGDAIKTRLNNIGITEIYQAVSNKKSTFLQYCEENDVKAENILYMGDDIPDLEVMQMVAISACPADAVAEIRQIANYISPFGAGKGCVRDVIEQVMKVQNKWLGDTAFHWNVPIN
jgi:3-deoxy-D-manno-octulosonate 8-phosphate phosphatase (KDO 8-P phosphatase)